MFCRRVFARREARFRFRGRKSGIVELGEIRLGGVAVVADGLCELELVSVTTVGVLADEPARRVALGAGAEVHRARVSRLSAGVLVDEGTCDDERAVTGFAVTVEPEDGSPKPTSDFLLVAP